VTGRDVNQIGEALDKAAAAGANNIRGVNFSVEDAAKLEADARARRWRVPVPARDHV